MPFPASPSDNQVHKENNRSFVWDNTLEVWDQLRDAPDTISILGAGKGLDNVTLGNSVVFPVGHVIQVVGDTGTTEYTSETELWNTKVTDLNVLITPSSASNKILLIGSAPVESSYSGSTGWRVMVDFYKNASDFTETYNLTGQDYGLGQSYMLSAAGRQQVTAMTMLDTAGTINEITYSISFKGTGGTVYAGGTASSLTTLTALEIKA